MYQTPFIRRWLLASTALGILSAPAATVTWTGGGTDGNIDNAGNWTPGLPAAGDELVFPDSASVLAVALNSTISPAKLSFPSTGTADYLMAGSGTVAGTGVVLTKSGDAYLTFGGTNSFTGEIRLNAGKLSLSNQNLTSNTSYALGAANNVIKIASGATFDFNGQGSGVHATDASRRYYSVELAGNGIETEPGVFAGAITSGNTGNLSFAGRGKSGFQHMKLTADASVNVPAGVTFDLAFGSGTSPVSSANGSITSAGASARVLTKNGSGTLYLGGTSVTAGPIAGAKIIIAEGDVRPLNANALGDEVTVASGAALRTATTATFPTPLKLQDGAVVECFSGIATLTGDLTIAGTPIFTATNSNSNLIIADSFTAPQDIEIRRTIGTSAVVFTGDNIIAEELFLTATGSLGAILQLGNGGTTGSFKDALGADAPVDLGSVGTLMLNRSDNITYNADITGTGTFQKNGTGTVRRTIAADFSRPGNTVAMVSAGTLLLNNTSGNGVGEGNVNVAAGSTLGGTGSVPGTVLLGTAVTTSSRAFLAPGDGPSAIGTFTIGGLQVISGGSGTLQLEVNGAASDKLMVNGDIILGPGKIAEIAITPFGSGATQGSYTLIEYTGTLHGTFTSLTGVPAGYRIRHDVSNKRVVLEQSASAPLLPQVMYFDGGIVDIATTGDAAASATAGNWNSTLLNWDQGAVAHLPWANDGSACAILAGGGYTVTVDAPAPLAVAGIKRFGSGNSATLITGGTIDLQAAAPLHESLSGTIDQGLRIASKLAGNGGFTISGGASAGGNHSRVTLLNPIAGNNTISGPVAINGGHLRLAASEQLGNATVITTNTVITNSVATLETGAGVNETIAGLNFGPNGGELKLGDTGASELTLDGGGLSIANAATFTYGNSASGIRFANAGELVKAGASNVTINRVNSANFIDLGGTRTIRVNDSGSLTIGVNLVNGALVKQGSGMLALTSDTNAYQGNTTVAEGTLRLTQPTLANGSTLELAADTVLDLGFATEATTDLVKSFIVDGVAKPIGRYAAVGTTLPGVIPLAEITGTGVIEVATPFDLWASQITDPTKRGKTDDPDGDGIDNLTEFAFDGNPSSGTAANKIEAKTFALAGENALVITLPVRTGAGAFTSDGNGLVSAVINGVIYRVQGSTDFVQWALPVTEVTGTPGITPPAAALSSPAWVYRSFRIDGPVSSRTRAFLRATASE